MEKDRLEDVARRDQGLPPIKREEAEKPHGEKAQLRLYLSDSDIERIVNFAVDTGTNRSVAFMKLFRSGYQGVYDLYAKKEISEEVRSGRRWVNPDWSIAFEEARRGLAKQAKHAESALKDALFPPEMSVEEKARKREKDRRRRKREWENEQEAEFQKSRKEKERKFFMGDEGGAEEEIQT